VSLARKGSKAITVGGTRYRWTVSEDSGYKVVVVEHSSGRGQRLEAQTPATEDWHAVAIRPAHVEELIKLAAAGGWTPQESGPPFRIGVPGQLPDN
jgi:hypothetical protein